MTELTRTDVVTPAATMPTTSSLKSVDYSPAAAEILTPTFTVGLDVGDRRTHYCVVDDQRKVVARGSFTTDPEAMAKALAEFPGARVALEAGSQSPWMSRALKKSGFQVHVVDPRRVQLISKDPRKNDRRDAETIARLEAGMPELLGIVHHRSEQAQADLSVIRARDALVRMRTMLVQQVRGLSKVFGVRLPATSTNSFAKRVRSTVPEVLLPAVEILLEHIADTSTRIRESDKLLARISEERYPEAVRLQTQIQGVGPVTSMAFVLTIEDPNRFATSRQVGSWIGLCPRSFASGDSNPELGISKAGDAYLRRLLLQCSHYITGHFGQDSDLRRFGERLAAGGGRGAKKRSNVAVARKLAVIMHHVWRTGVDFNPLHNAERQALREAV